MIVSKKKKWLALLLVVVMLFVNAPLGVFAKEPISEPVESQSQVIPDNPDIRAQTQDTTGNPDEHASIQKGGGF